MTAPDPGKLPDSGELPDGELKGDPLALPFDQYQRYRLVADLLGQLRHSGERPVPLEVLDVGGRTALLRRFLLRDRITLVDMEPSEEERLVLGDGGRLPFQDGSFDVVTAFDTLEHVPPEHREAFVAECCRVARKWVVLAGPYHAERVAEAEELLKRFLLEKLGVEHRYLNEHRTHGLPDRAAVEEQMAELGAEVVSIGHANLDRWLVLMCVTMYMYEDPALRGLARAFSRFYNASLYASDHAEPVYRHLLVAAKDGAALPQAEAFLEPPVAPAGALAGFEQFTAELLAFDRERDEWRDERERLREVAGDLEEDLAGHRAGLTEARAQVRQLGKVRDVLASDLGGHRERLSEELAETRRLRSVAEDLKEDLGGHKDSLSEARDELRSRAEALRDLELELERERRVGEESRQVLARDLVEHRKTLGEKTEELSAVGEAYEKLLRGAEREREEQVKVRGDLERQLSEHREVLAARDAQLSEQLGLLDEARRERAALARDLTEHRRTLDDQRGVIADKDEGIEHLESEVHRLEAMAGEIQAQLVATEQRRAALEAELEAARARLRDRWGNLKRALGPKP